jgi:hypothetical protein
MPTRSLHVWLATLWLGALATSGSAQAPTAGAVQLTVDPFALAPAEAGPPIRNAPYSAEATTEIVQTLADGNRIVRRTSARLYRDSRGRTRREVALDGIAGIMVAGAPLRMITISDPESGMTYFVDSGKVVALPPRSVPNRGGATTGAPQTWTGQVSGSGQSGAVTGQAGGGSFQIGGTSRPPANAEREDALGTREIEGLRTEGTRTTVSIPAGAIGNERPIETVTERWFSPELRIVVLSRSSDPRFGTTTYRLTKITRAEPATALFEPPPR